MLPEEAPEYPPESNEDSQLASMLANLISAAANQPVPITPTRSQPSHRVADAHLTVVETIYHQCDEGQPSSVITRFNRQLYSQESPYQKVIEVSEEWQIIECKVFNECGYLVLSNLGPSYQVKPSLEQQALDEAKVIEVGCVVPTIHEPRTMHSKPRQVQEPIAMWLLGPRESMRGQPANLQHLALRCQKGVARCRIHYYPT